MSERPKELASKASVVQATVGSNPTVTARVALLAPPVSAPGVSALPLPGRSPARHPPASHHRSAGFPAVRQPSRRPPVSPVGTPALRSSACLPGVCLPCRRECLSCGRMLALQRRHTIVRQANRGSTDCAGRGVGGILGSSWSQVGYPEHWSPRAPDKSRWVTKWKPALNAFVITAVSAGGVSPWTARSTHPTTHEHGNCDQSRAQLSPATSRSHHRNPEPRKSCRLFDVAPRILSGSPGCAGGGDQRRWR